MGNADGCVIINKLHYLVVGGQVDWTSFFVILVCQGRFEILSLGGSVFLNESGSPHERSGGLSVSLSGPDGRVLGGGVAGLLIAASPVQVHLY